MAPRDGAAAGARQSQTGRAPIRSGIIACVTAGEAGMEQPALLAVEVPREEPRIVRCRWCRRPLRDTESRALAAGPGCHDRVGYRRDWDIEQEPLPGLPSGS